MAVDVLPDAVVGELADDPARDSPDGDRRQQRRREEANREPYPAPSVVWVPSTSDVTTPSSERARRISSPAAGKAATNPRLNVARPQR